MTEDQNKTKVLVVDDERVIAETLATILCRSGFNAIASHSGEAAVEMAADFHPDIVISDVVMGPLNGIEAGIRIRALLPDCRIFLFSGQQATGDLLEKARAQGHQFEVLAKPLHPIDLLLRIQN